MIKATKIASGVVTMTSDAVGDLAAYLNSRANNNRYASFRNYEAALFVFTGEWTIQPNKRGENCLVAQVEMVRPDLTRSNTFDWVYVNYNILNAPKDYEQETTLWLPTGSLNYKAVNERWALLSVHDAMCRIEAFTGCKFAVKKEENIEGTIVIVNDPANPPQASRVFKVKKENFTGRYVSGAQQGQYGRMEFPTFVDTKKALVVPAEDTKQGGNSQQGGNDSSSSD